MALKKHKLANAIDEDFAVLGLVSDDPDYTLCWRMNQSLGTGFTRLDDLEVYHRKLDAVQAFSLFEYAEEETLLTYRIIRNRSDQGYFLEELKNLDYLVHVQGEISTDSLGRFAEGIASLEGVRLCVPVDLGRIRNLDRLSLW